MKKTTFLFGLLLIALTGFAQTAEDYYDQAGKKYESGDYEGALVLTNKAIELEPDIGGWYRSRGYLKHELEDYVGAIADFDKAIEMIPDEPDSYYNRGESKLRLGHKESACVDFYKALELGLEFNDDTIKDNCE